MSGTDSTRDTSRPAKLCLPKVPAMEKRRVMRKAVLIGAALVFASAVAFASVSFDPATGTGFVGKGDVQLVYGWNNKQLQDNAGAVGFQATSVSRVFATWTCDSDAGPQTQHRLNFTTTSTQKVPATIARERNQVTGFILNGYSGTPTVTEQTIGPSLGYCSPSWTAINLVQGEPVPVSSGLQVCVNGDCQPIQ